MSATLESMRIVSRFARPSLGEYRPQRAALDAPLRATFAGTSTVLLADGSHSVMIDGFFSRPSKRRVLLGRIAPDTVAVDEGLRLLGARPDAVICAHSHYDHALDAPLVAERTGALLVGSRSTANLGRGHGLPEERLRTISDGDELRFGEFAVTMIESEHSPGDRIPGTIESPVRAPARATEWRCGEAYSVLIDHPAGSVLIQASANFRPGALRGRRADTVYLSIGGLGNQSPLFRAEYWREVVETTGARRVVPVHWDDFFRPPPLVPLPGYLDDVGQALSFLRDHCDRAGLDLEMPEYGVPADPFAPPNGRRYG